MARAVHVLLLFDYDGTLAPIAPRPDLAILPPRTRAALAALSQRPLATLGIVSGRGLDDVAGMVALPGFIYAGNHGLEIQGPSLKFVHPEAEAARPLLDQVRDALRENLSGYEGVLVEGKGLTLSVHYRLTPEDVRPAVIAGFERVLEDLKPAGRFRVTRGKEVLEVRPDVPWDKGKAISRIASECPCGSLAFYFGDDLTDEDGFAAIHDMNGISVFVGEARQPTRALYRVDSPAEVTETLELMARL